MYLAQRGPVYPSMQESDNMCGDCGQRPAAWGDWLCEKCRQRLEREIAEMEACEEES